MNCLKEFNICFCSLDDLQKPQIELDAKACAAVGQSSLMALYDTLFSQVSNKLFTISFWIWDCIRAFVLQYFLHIHS